MSEPAIGTTVGSRRRFRLDRKLGGGSFGAVFEAFALDSAGRPLARVAVKVLYGDLPDRARTEALQREISALAAIHSPRIPRLLDASLDHRPPFLAMEYFPHGSLADLLARVGSLDEDAAVTLLDALLEALDAAHAVGVLHLDVKPANVLVDGTGTFVLADFGVAYAPRVGSPMPGLGSSGWQAPEQERREVRQFDLRTDLHGVGLTVWSALTGVDLASREGAALRARAAQSTVTMPPPSIVRKSPLSPGFERLLMSLLARESTSRPGSATSVREELRRFREGHADIVQQIPGKPVTQEEGERVLASVVDPLVARALRTEARTLRRLEDREVLCQEGERSFLAFVLVRGAVRVIRNHQEIAWTEREGEFLGEIAALTGEPRNATLVADGITWIRPLDAAQLETIAASNPAIAVRLIRTMAARFKAREGGA